MKKTPLKRGIYCTDIHFGKKANSELHNEDCLRFLDWFCKKAKEEKCDYAAFLGDWNENRSALNVATLNYSYLGAKKLNELGIPVFFVVGNHDLYHRNTRKVYSIVPFQEFTNFVIIDTPKIIKEIKGGALFCPYLFHDEYPTLAQYFNIPFWAGHFEFQGFQITGYNTIMMHGPNPADFSNGPKYIVSGHFHKRQANKNVVYMGNCFPMDYNDANDFERGLMIMDHDKMKMEFHNWDDCPKYIATNLSDLLDGNVKMYPEARVKCYADIPLSYEESLSIKQTFLDKYKLREFVVEETEALTQVLQETEVEVDVKDVNLSNLATVDQLVVQMLQNIESDQIESSLLVEIYSGLEVTS